MHSPPLKRELRESSSVLSPADLMPAIRVAPLLPLLSSIYTDICSPPCVRDIPTLLLQQFQIGLRRRFVYILPLLQHL